MKSDWIANQNEQKSESKIKWFASRINIFFYFWFNSANQNESIRSEPWYKVNKPFTYLFLELKENDSLLKFLREFLLVAEVAYIERNGAVISLLPSILGAAVQNADLEELQETMARKGNEARIIQMLLYSGLR